MSIHDYSLVDLLFAFWFKQKRKSLSRNEAADKRVETRLNELRPLRNPEASIFILG